MALKSLGKKALSILKGIAPVAASAVGGPFAGPALAIISKVAGVDEDKVDDFILSASPDQLLQLKQAEIEFDKWREQAGIRKEELLVEDRQGARQLARDKGLWIQGTLTYLFIGGYFTLMYLFFSNGALDGLSDFAKGQLGILIGVLTAAVPQMLAFWFGSSRGSKEKTEAMAAVANGK